MPTPNPDYDTPVTEGFTGTVQGFIAWLNLNLVYGGAVISDPEPHPHIPGKKMLVIKLITAGYSLDESLIGRVARFGGGSLFALAFGNPPTVAAWKSSIFLKTTSTQPKSKPGSNPPRMSSRRSTGPAHWWSTALMLTLP